MPNPALTSFQQGNPYVYAIAGAPNSYPHPGPVYVSYQSNGNPVYVYHQSYVSQSFEPTIPGNTEVPHLLTPQPYRIDNSSGYSFYPQPSATQVESNYIPPYMSYYPSQNGPTVPTSPIPMYIEGSPQTNFSSVPHPLKHSPIINERLRRRSMTVENCLEQEVECLETNIIMKVFWPIQNSGGLLQCKICNMKMMINALVHHYHAIKHQNALKRFRKIK